MKIRGVIGTLSAVALAASLSAQAQVKIGVVVSATGTAAFVGIPQKNAVALLPMKIGNTTIEYITYDDASDPTQSVTLAKKLLTEYKIDALIGPSGSPNAMGMLQVMAEAQTPMLAPVGTAAVVLPMDEKKRWVYKTHPNDDVISDGLVAAMMKRGVKTIGFIGRSDPYGQNWAKTFEPMAQKAGMQIVANERYNRQDTSVTGQVLKLIAAKPDAVLVAGVAADAAMPHMQLVDSGYKGQIYHTHGSASGAFIQIGGKQVEGALVVGPLLLVPEQIPDSVPTKKVALEFVTGYERLYNAKPPIFAAGVYDAGLLFQHAIPEAVKKGKPGTQEFRTALRDALEGIKNLNVSQGVVNMSAQDHSGFDHRGRVLLTIKDGKWVLVKD
ncbi:MAG: branched-chain amino acid ABC transporter substrate-binding protein [Betaproteobacteria bacterium RIFCSPLOWO2_12_FULL_64_23]|nr:MAG: branched-chain amino acid ABC transporter substrate-binding protein [Betaproteobacteria bacterium RIFCSPLOWO2_12_FULL_64_23]